MKYYRDHYDAIIIGGALAGLSAAIELAEAGLSVLVLERRNCPGGLTASIVRQGLEMELSLHEMSGIGAPKDRLNAGKFFDRHGIGIRFLPVPECYTIAWPEKSVTLHPGFEVFASETEKAVPGSYESVLRFLELCNAVFESVNKLASPSLDGLHNSLHDFDILFKTAGYSTKDVMDSLDVPPEAEKLLSPYWLYVGSPLSVLPFTVYALLAGDYIGHGSYIPAKFSHEIPLRMAEKAEELGVQIEYCQEVEKILVSNGRTAGVRTRRKDTIAADYVISGAYPELVFSQMIEPLSEVPKNMLRLVNSRSLSFTVFTLLLMLDQTPEELGIDHYCVFTSESTDTERIFFENIVSEGPYEALIGVCLNRANPEAVPKGLCSFSITALLRPEAFEKVHKDNYMEVRDRIAEEILTAMEKRLKAPLKEHILEAVTVTPETISRYSNSPGGCIYGYRHTMEHHVAARLLSPESEEGIRGLVFAGAHSAGGDGMGTQILNGETAAKAVLELYRRENSLLSKAVSAIGDNEYEGR